MSLSSRSRRNIRDIYIKMRVYTWYLEMSRSLAVFQRRIRFSPTIRFPGYGKWNHLAFRPSVTFDLHNCITRFYFSLPCRGYCDILRWNTMSCQYMKAYRLRSLGICYLMINAKAEKSAWDIHKSSLLREFCHFSILFYGIFLQCLTIFLLPFRIYNFVCNKFTIIARS